MIKLQAEKAKLTLLEPPELLTTGMQRAVMCKLIFGPAWDGLHKTAVFRAGDVVRDVPEENWEEGACPIPPEVLRKAGLTVLIGVYGTDCDRVVLPTVWCSLGAVRAGANPSGDPSAEESLPVWEDLRREISNLKQELLANPGMYQDVTQQYLDACESNQDLLGEDFLQALPEGQYCILLPYAKYLARNVNSGDIPYSDTIYYEDDGFIYQYRYMNHQLVETWESFLSDSDTELFCSVKAIAETAAQFPALQREVADNTARIEDLEKGPYTDVSGQYADALDGGHDQSESDFLAVLPEGRYYLKSECRVCYARNVSVAGVDFSVITVYDGDDMCMNRCVYINEELAEAWDTCPYDKPVYVSAREIADNTSRIEDVEKLATARAAAVQCDAAGSEVTLPDSADAPLADLQISGNTVIWPTSYRLITSADQLIPGMKIVIASSGDPYAMSGKQAVNNRSGVGITKNEDGTISLDSSVAEFILQAGVQAGTYSFYDAGNKGYLYAASSTGNYLRTKSYKDSDASWTIAVTPRGFAAIQAQGESKNNLLRFNKISKYFACYPSMSQLSVWLYAKIEAPQGSPAMEYGVVNANMPSIIIQQGSERKKTVMLNGVELGKWDDIIRQDGKWKQRTWQSVVVFDQNTTAEAYTDDAGQIIDANVFVLRNVLMEPAYGDAITENGQKIPQCLCDRYSAVSSATAVADMPDKSIKVGDDCVSVIIRDHGYDDCQNFSHALPSLFVYRTKKPLNITTLSTYNGNQMDGLATYYPDTTIRMDQGCQMALRYNVDTKRYIDKKCEELAALLAAAGEQ